MLSNLQKKTILELIKYIEEEQANPVITFDMSQYALNTKAEELWSPDEAKYTCNTQCCLLGLHAIRSETKISDWGDYADSLGMPSHKEFSLWKGLFGMHWEDDLEAAKRRCIFVLENEDKDWDSIRLSQHWETFEVSVAS